MGFSLTQELGDLFLGGLDKLLFLLISGYWNMLVVTAFRLLSACPVICPSTEQRLCRRDAFRERDLG